MKENGAIRGDIHRIPYPNNMGVVRYILAFAVVFAHFNELTGSRIWFPLSSYSAVGGFFALSGFLIYGSYRKRPGARAYLKARARRLLPAYFLTVTGAAVLCGLLSTIPSGSYFSSAGFWEYLAANLSFLNFLHPTLPGVFESNLIPAVNGSLWTMKVEWALYLSVPIIFTCIARYGRRPALWIVSIIVLAICYRLGFYQLYITQEKEIYNILGRQFFGQLSYFYAGALCYNLLPQFLKYRWTIFGIAILLCSCGGWIPYYNIVIQPLSLSVLVIWFSIVGRWGTWEGKRDNVSYNIYLCHFPVIQTYVCLGCPDQLAPGIGLTVCSLATLVISYFILLGEKGIRNFLLPLGNNPKKS